MDSFVGCALSFYSVKCSVKLNSLEDIWLIDHMVTVVDLKGWSYIALSAEWKIWEPHNGPIAGLNNRNVMIILPWFRFSKLTFISIKNKNGLKIENKFGMISNHFYIIEILVYIFLNIHSYLATLIRSLFHRLLYICTTINKPK